jgi:hypothetical protein
MKILGNHVEKIDKKRNGRKRENFNFCKAENLPRTVSASSEIKKIIGSQTKTANENEKLIAMTKFTSFRKN